MLVDPKNHRGPGDCIMVVVAHPDDAEFMCAGSVAAWVAEGREVIYTLVTSGDKGTEDAESVPAEFAVLREQEQRNVCGVLGVKTIEFLRQEDGMVQNTLALRKEIVRVIRRHKPSAIITQNPTSRWSGNYVTHPDHRATGDATMDAVFPSARDVHMFPDLALNEGLRAHIVDHLYLGDRSNTADVYFDVSETIDTKVQALMEHVSQIPDPKKLSASVREGAELLGKKRGMGFAESFKYFYLGKD
jgi:LmbE family N-acetylglucosaminyl deacetylase